MTGFEQADAAAAAIAVGTVVDQIERTTSTCGDKPAYVAHDYSRETAGETTTVTFAELGTRVRAVAARLQQVTTPGDRVAILAPQGAEYIIGFFAAIHAGLVAVPLFDPSEPGHTDRLTAVLADCTPAVVLTTASASPGVREFFKGRPAAQRPRSIAIEGVPDSLAASWSAPDVAPDDVAYLQYTSGSTRVPAGVEITHRAVLTNVVQMITSYRIPVGEGRGVSWLPLFHDMGLLVVVIAGVGGMTCQVLSPRAFVQRPLRWITLLGEGSGVVAAAPDFGFDHAAKRGLPKEGDDVDLSGVLALINGSEPVRAGTLERFHAAFAPYGLPESAVRPSYGMAEATLFVAASRAGERPTVRTFDRDEMAAGRVVALPADDPRATTQVAVGDVSLAQQVRIVHTDEATGAPTVLGEDAVGEIWIAGDNLGRGYWGRPEETEETFGGVLPDEPGTRWLRTGDLGAVVEGQLYVTGRVKDLIIVGGRNHYPQDVEFSAEQASDVLRPGFVAAFSVPPEAMPAGDGEGGPADDPAEQLVLVAERAMGKGKADPEPVVAAVRAAIASRHGITAREVLLVPGGSIPRTSSGKIARRACRQRYLDGTLRGAAGPVLTPRELGVPT
ncbi:long-chain-fatty-acid--AMP ligase FadD32 [Rhodococcus aerolatus]